MILKSDKKFAEEYRKQREADLEEIYFKLAMHEAMIQELVEDVKKYVKEHYDGKEESV